MVRKRLLTAGRLREILSYEKPQALIIIKDKKGDRIHGSIYIQGHFEPLKNGG